MHMHRFMTLAHVERVARHRSNSASAGLYELTCAKASSQQAMYVNSRSFIQCVPMGTESRLWATERVKLAGDVSETHMYQVHQLTYHSHSSMILNGLP